MWMGDCSGCFLAEDEAELATGTNDGNDPSPELLRIFGGLLRFEPLVISDGNLRGDSLARLEILFVAFLFVER